MVKEAAGLIGADIPLWNGDADEVLVCREVRDETPDVKTFLFAAPQPRRFAFAPGQFATFEMEIAGETIYRCYTIASAPTHPFTVAITVKRVAGGPVSNWLHDTMKPGAALKASLPGGQFSCFTAPAAKYLFISGGSGITPLMSMTRTLCDLGLAADIVFIHAARSPADVIFRDELAVMARRSPSLKVAHICEADSPLEAWHGYRGRLSAPMLAAIDPDLAEREAFVCGPTPFMAAVKTMLAELGHLPARYHEESFVFEALPDSVREAAIDSQPEPGAAPVPVYRIEFAKTRRAIDCPANMAILQAAKLAGVRLPSSCTKGECSTCKSKILAGTYHQPETSGIRAREVAAGMALLCCARPTSDLVIDR